MYASLRKVPLTDLTYFLRPAVEDQRVVDGAVHRAHTDLSGDVALRTEFSSLQPALLTSDISLLIGGTPVFDEKTGNIKYDIRVINGRATSSHPLTDYGAEPMLSFPYALMARQNILAALSQSELPAGFTAEIVPLGEEFYVVVATITPDSRGAKHKVNKKLAEIIKRMGSRTLSH